MFLDHWPTERVAGSCFRPCRLAVSAILIAVGLGASPATMATGVAAATTAHFEHCRQTPSANCLVWLAQSELNQISDHSGYVVGVAEIVLALSDQAARISFLAEQAEQRIELLDSAQQRAQALLDLSSAVAGLQLTNPDVLTLIGRGEKQLQQVSDQRQRWDVAGKFAVARARAGHESSAAAIAYSMPQGDDYLASLKARTLHDIVPIQAERGDIKGALATLSATTMGLSYYQVSAKSKVAKFISDAGQPELAHQLLEQAGPTARAQTDGYFMAGALRRIGDAYVTLKDARTGLRYFNEAIDSALTQSSPQKKARALSRIASSMADHGYFDQARAILPQAVSIARSEPSDQLRAWTFYEIAGASAFAGDFETAKTLADDIPADTYLTGKSLKSAALRDIAWGQARHGQLVDALDTAAAIESARERVQALSRIVRLLQDPSMQALPRYL